MTQTLPAPAPPLTFLVCGDPVDAHKPGCALDQAEQIAYEAADVAADTGGHPIVAVLVALHEARLLHAMPADDADATVEGLLDYLWESGLLGPAGASS